MCEDEVIRNSREHWKGADRSALTREVRGARTTWGALPRSHAKGKRSRTPAWGTAWGAPIPSRNGLCPSCCHERALNPPEAGQGSGRTPIPDAHTPAALPGSLHRAQLLPREGARQGRVPLVAGRVDPGHQEEAMRSLARPSFLRQPALRRRLVQPGATDESPHWPHASRSFPKSRLCVCQLSA